MINDESLPASAGEIAERYPELWKAFVELGKTTATAGPLDGKSLRLVKLALAIGAGLEGAVHSHTRRALAEGISGDELRHVALSAIPTLGFGASLRGLSWIEDLVK